MRAVSCVMLAACSAAHGDPAATTSAAPPEPIRVRATPPVPTAEAPLLGDPAASGRVVGARVAVQVGDGAIDDRPAYARIDQLVTLYAVVEVADARGVRTTFTDAPSLRHAGHAVHVEPLAHAPRLAIAWKRVEPAAVSYSNTDDTGFHFTPIEYRATAITAAANAASVRADVRPTLTPDYGHGVGTMRYQIVVTPQLDGDAAVPIASAGPSARRGRGSGGLSDDVTRVSIRRDDTYLGYLTEMFGQPYVWASAGLTDATHQSERLEGSDCADFVVYGARRMGSRVAYTWTGGLPEITHLLAAGTRGADGIYRDAHGTPIAFTRPGDLILFPRHVGALVEDRGTPGVLDDQDLIMHTLFDTPKTEALADSGYADKPVELRRFR